MTTDNWTSRAGHILTDWRKSWCLPKPTEPSPIKIFIFTDNASNMKAALNGTNYCTGFVLPTHCNSQSLMQKIQHPT
ncbi:hypothetical protein PR048_005875 [Dryococelus australis]|uniref:Uncharacterized protein n=1 Tax=Dryococelus australis TaxID=614101 RepID=A0ABQ9I9F5_9NEOP|nr:hypothetical protein PR048_005875 [Dryococelus australis]